MKQSLSRSTIVISTLLLISGCVLKQTPRILSSEKVLTDADLTSDVLIQKLKDEGRLMDYSYAGYRAGEKSLPNSDTTVNLKIDFGAKGDGKTDDTQSLINAIAKTKEGVIFIPAGKYVITQQIKISKSNLVLRGEGQDKTILYYPKSLTEVYGNKVSSAGVSQWSFGPSFITIEGQDPIDSSTLITNLDGDSVRGSKVIKVRDSSHMKLGQWVRLVQSDPPNSGTLLHALLKNLLPTQDMLKGEKNALSFHSRIIGIAGDLVTLERALPFDVKVSWTPELHVYKTTVEEVGVEELTIEFPVMPYPDHFKEAGYNAITLKNAANSWIRNVKILNADIAVEVNNSYFSTVEGVVIDSTSKRDGGFGNWNGHHAIYVVRGADNLITQFDIRTRFAHDLCVGWFTTNTVFSNGKGKDINLDHHRAFNYATLFTNIDLGEGKRAFESGGAPQRGPHAGAFSTYWNIRAKQSFASPKGDFGPALNFVNLNFNDAPTPTKLDWRVVDSKTLSVPDLHESMRKSRLGH